MTDRLSPLRLAGPSPEQGVAGVRLPDPRIVIVTPDDSAVEAVVIDGPLVGRADAIRAALFSGQAVLSPLPIADDVETVDALVSLALARKAILCPDAPTRYEPAVTKVASIVESDELGRIATMRTWRTLPFPSRDEGNLFDLALLGDLDALIGIVGEVVRVHAHTAQSSPGRPYQAFMAISIRFASGAIGHIEARFGHTPRFAIEVTAQHGMLSFDTDSTATLTLDPTSTSDARASLGNPAVRIPAQLVFDHFVENVLSARTEPAAWDIEGWRLRHIARVRAAVWQSLKVGGPVPVAAMVDGDVA